MLNISGEQISLSFPNMKGNSSCFTLKCDVSSKFSRMHFIRLRMFPSIPSLMRVFIMNNRWIFQMLFLMLYIEMVIWFSFFVVNTVDYNDVLLNVEIIIHSWGKLLLDMMYILFHVFWNSINNSKNSKLFYLLDMLVLL